MSRFSLYISRFSAIAASLTIAVSPVWSQSNGSIQPRKGDANRLRSATGQSILPTNINQFSPSVKLPTSNLKIQKIDLEVGTIEPVLPGNYNASPQKVNKVGNFSSDPLNAVQIFQDNSRSRSN